MKTQIVTFLREEDGFIGSLISAGTQLIGGILNRKAEDKRYNQMKEDELNKFKTLRQAAKKGGFNPLTALMATGGDLSSSTTPPLASNSFIAGTLGDLASAAFGDKKADTEAERADLENDLLRVKIEQARAGVITPDATVRSGGLRTRGQAAVAVSNTQTAMNGQTYQEAEPAFDAVGNPLTPAIAKGGYTMVTDPNISDAEVIEQRYGDIAQEIHGAQTYWRDSQMPANKAERQIQNEKAKDAYRFEWWRNDLVPAGFGWSKNPSLTGGNNRVINRTGTRTYVPSLATPTSSSIRKQTR